MSEAEIIRLIKRVLEEQLAPVLMANIVSNESQTRSTFQRVPTEGPIPNARNIQPYGFSSRAPVGTAALAVPVDGNPTHINVVGHFDDSRPTGADGESFLYNQWGQMVYLSNGKIQVGTKSSDENLVLGKVFKAYSQSLLQLIIDHVHIGDLGYDTSPPTNSEDFQNLLDSPINDSAILSDVAFTEKGS